MQHGDRRNMLITRRLVAISFDYPGMEIMFGHRCRRRQYFRGAKKFYPKCLQTYAKKMSGNGTFSHKHDEDLFIHFL